MTASIRWPETRDWLKGLRRSWGASKSPRLACTGQIWTRIFQSAGSWPATMAKGQCTEPPIAGCRGRKIPGHRKSSPFGLNRELAPSHSIGLGGKPRLLKTWSRSPGPLVSVSGFLGRWVTQRVTPVSGTTTRWAMNCLRVSIFLSVFASFMGSPCSAIALHRLREGWARLAKVLRPEIQRRLHIFKHQTDTIQGVPTEPDAEMQRIIHEAGAEVR